MGSFSGNGTLAIELFITFDWIINLVLNT